MSNILGLELALNTRRQEERGGAVFRLGDSNENPAVGLGVVGGIEYFRLKDEISVGPLGREPAERIPADFENAIYQRVHVFLDAIIVEVTVKIGQGFPFEEVDPPLLGRSLFLSQGERNRKSGKTNETNGTNWETFHGGIPFMD